MVICLPKPLFVEEVVDTCTLRDRSLQLLGMCMSDPHGIVAPTAQAPCHHRLHIEYPLVLHPRENAVPQAIWTAGVFGVGRAIRCPWYLNNDNSPTTADELVASLGIVGTVAIQASNEKDSREGILRISGDRRSNIDRYGSALFLGLVDVGDMLFRQWIDPVSCSCHVC